MKYTIKQETPEGPWQSEPLEARDLYAVRQCIIAGFINGHARWAVDESGSLLYGIRADGNSYSP